MINEFLENFTSSSTKNGYKSHLNKYFKFLGENPDTYFDKDRDYKQDVLRFSQSLKDRPPCSQQTIMSTVKLFLSEYDVERRIFLEYINKVSKLKDLLEVNRIA